MLIISNEQYIGFAQCNICSGDVDFIFGIMREHSIQYQTDLKQSLRKPFSRII